MALPVILGVVAAAGSLYSAYAANQAGQEGQRVAGLDAQAARAATEDAIRRAREEAERTVSTVRARTAGAGLDPGFGSPLEVIAQTYRNLEADVTALARTGGAQVRRSLLEGSFARQAGRDAMIGNLFRAGTSVVSAAALSRQPAARAPLGTVGTLPGRGVGDYYNGGR